MTNTETKTPIALRAWCSNGSINSLVRTDAQLRQLAGVEYPEAVRWAAMHLTNYKLAGTPERLAKITNNGGQWNPTDTECTETVNAFLADRQTPFWKKQPPIVTKKGKSAFTTAQLLAIHGNLDCGAQCQNLQDLLECFNLMGGYNGFEVEKATRHFLNFNRHQYYNQDNCNNGNELFKYSYGFEYSPVVYIECIFYNRALVITPDGGHYEELTKEAFRIMCRTLGECTDADENGLCDETENSVKWRLWWD